MSLLEDLRRAAGVHQDLGEPDSVQSALTEARLRESDAFMKHCVNKVSSKVGGNIDKAFAICTAQGQEAGYYKPGTRTLTPKGKAAVKKHKDEPEHSDKVSSYKGKIGEGRMREATVEGELRDLPKYLDQLGVSYKDRSVGGMLVYWVTPTFQFRYEGRGEWAVEMRLPGGGVHRQNVSTFRELQKVIKTARRKDVIESRQVCEGRIKATQWAALRREMGADEALWSLLKTLGRRRAKTYVWGLTKKYSERALRFGGDDVGEAKTISDLVDLFEDGAMLGGGFDTRYYEWAVDELAMLVLEKDESVFHEIAQRYEDVDMHEVASLTLNDAPKMARRINDEGVVWDVNRERTRFELGSGRRKTVIEFAFPDAAGGGETGWTYHIKGRPGWGEGGPINSWGDFIEVIMKSYDAGVIESVECDCPACRRGDRCLRRREVESTEHVLQRDQMAEADVSVSDIKAKAKRYGIDVYYDDGVLDVVPSRGTSPRDYSAFTRWLGNNVYIVEPYETIPGGGEAFIVEPLEEGVIAERFNEREVAKRARHYGIDVDYDSRRGTLSVTPSYESRPRDYIEFMDWLEKKYELEPLETSPYGQGEEFIVHEARQFDMAEEFDESTPEWRTDDQIARDKYSRMAAQHAHLLEWTGLTPPE